MTATAPGPGPAPLPPPRSPAAARLGTAWRLLVHLSRTLLLAFVTGFALLGAVVTPLFAMLVVAPLVGAFVAGVVAVVHPTFGADPAGRATALRAFAGGAVLVPLAGGVGLFGEAGVVLVALLLLLASVVATGWLAEVGTDRRPAD